MTVFDSFTRFGFARKDRPKAMASASFFSMARAALSFHLLKVLSKGRYCRGTSHSRQDACDALEFSGQNLVAGWDIHESRLSPWASRGFRDIMSRII
jgi:hypothetical protein